MVGGVGSRALASCGAVAAALAIVAVAASPAAAKELDRYSIVHGCYSLASASGGPAAVKGGDGYAMVPGDAEAFRMQATDLGRYLL
jgi:hypothetical protein